MRIALDEILGGVSVRIPKDRGELLQWASRYEYGEADRLAEQAGRRLRERTGGLDDLRDLYGTKMLATYRPGQSFRTHRFLQPMYEAGAVDICCIAAVEPSSLKAIKMLDGLPGIAIPTATWFLTWLREEGFPVLDFRVLWTVNSTRTANSYKTLEWYLGIFDELQRYYDVSTRELDRALWSISKVGTGTRHCEGPSR